MRISTRLFATYRDLAGTSSVAVELPAGATVGDLVHALRSNVAGLDRLPASVAVAVNREYAQPGDPISDGDEIALIPPVAGG